MPFQAPRRALSAKGSDLPSFATSNVRASPRTLRCFPTLRSRPLLGDRCIVAPRPRIGPGPPRSLPLSPSRSAGPSFPRPADRRALSNRGISISLHSTTRPIGTRAWPCFHLLATASSSPKETPYTLRRRDRYGRLSLSCGTLGELQHGRASSAAASEASVFAWLCFRLLVTASVLQKRRPTRSDVTTAADIGVFRVARSANFNTSVQAALQTVKWSVLLRDGPVVQKAA